MAKNSLQRQPDQFDRVVRIGNMALAMIAGIAILAESLYRIFFR